MKIPAKQLVLSFSVLIWQRLSILFWGKGPDPWIYTCTTSTHTVNLAWDHIWREITPDQKATIVFLLTFLLFLYPETTLHERPPLSLPVDRLSGQVLLNTKSLYLTGCFHQRNMRTFLAMFQFCKRRLFCLCFVCVRQSVLDTKYFLGLSGFLRTNLFANKL